MLPDSLKLASDLASRIKNHENRIERLESLEHANAAFLPSMGCIDFLDYTISAGGVASVHVDVPPNPYPTGDYGWTHLTGFYYAEAGSPGTRTLRMTVNSIVTTVYGYTYKWAAASAGPTVVSADLQTSFAIARLLGYYRTSGWFQIPFYPMPMQCHCFGEYVAYDGGAAVGSKVERGEFSGVKTGGGAEIVNRIDLFASAGNISVGLFLYGWCPRWVAGSGPPD